MSSTRRSSSASSTSPASITSSPSGPSHPHRGTLVPLCLSASRRFSSHDRGLARSSPSRASSAGFESSSSTSSRSCASLGSLDAFSRDIGAPAKSRSSSSSSATLRTVSLTRNLAASAAWVSASVRRMASAWHRSCSSCRSAAAASPWVMSISTALASSAHACPVCPGAIGGACLHLCRRNITAACCRWSAGSSRTFLAYASHGRRSICTSLGEKWSSSSALKRMADAPAGRTLPRLAFSSDVSTGAGGEAMGAPSRWGGPLSTRAASVLADERAPSSASASDETSATSESATKRNTARPARPRRHGANIVPPPGPARVPCPDPRSSSSPYFQF